MLKEQTRPHQANTNALEHLYCERVRDVYQTIHRSGLDKFTFSWIERQWQELNVVVSALDRLPEPVFREMIEVIGRLRAASDELRLARFLFDLKEINPVHRWIMRNRAVLRSEILLQNVLQVWPAGGVS
jgi:hypothetical protein